MNMRKLKVTDLSLESQHDLPNVIPTNRYWLIENHIMNAEGGISRFGMEDWEMILEDIHPDVNATELEFTLQ